MKRFGMIAAVAVLVTGAVHHGALRQEVAGADRARVAGFEPDWDAPGFARAGERDLSPLIYRLEGLLFDDRHPLYALAGLVIVAIAACLGGLAADRLARELRREEDRRFMSAGTITAALVAAHPLSAELAAHLPGQVTALALALFAGLAHRGARRPDALHLLALPLVASLLFRETLGLGFLLLPPLVLLSRPRTLRSLAARPAALGLGLIACLLRIGYEIHAGLPSGARDVGADREGFLAGLEGAARWLVVPVAEGKDGLAPVWLASFGVPLLFLLALGRGALDSGRRRAALGAIAVLGGGLALAACAPPPSAGGGDLRVLALPLFGLALWLGLSAEAAARRGPSELVVLALLAFSVYSSFNASADWRRHREAEVFGPEYQAVSAEIDRVVAQGAERLAIHGLAAGSRSRWRQALPARHLAPWGRGEARISAWAEDEVGVVPAELIPERGGIVLAEWWPGNFLYTARRPEGWRLVPVLVAPRAPVAEAPIRLVSPAPDARVQLRRPERIEDDTTFVFESAPGWSLPEDGLFAFYSIYRGGLNPRGRGEVRARPLVPGTLVSEPAGEGWTRHRWRPSIRPEDGHDGVRFEDPDLGASGPFIWTIGAVRLAAADSGGIPQGHAGHLHDRAAIGITRPFAVAQTRRVHFLAPSRGR